MNNALVEWLVKMLLKNLDSAVAAKALVSVLRAAVGALKDVAARTSSNLDDAVVAKAAEVVEDIAKALGVGA